MQDSHDETMLLLRLMGLEDEVRVEAGATHAMPDESTPVDSPGARLIIEEAMKDDDRPLHIAFYGPVTDMASALLLEPKIEDRGIRVIWIGGGNWPNGGREYNLSNDIHAANVVMKSNLEVWQVPRSTYRSMGVGYAELIEKVYPQGEIGKYLIEQLLEHNAGTRPEMEYRSLGDSPCIGIILDPECGQFSWRPAPTFDQQMHYIHSGQYRPIRVYENVNTRFIHEDLFAKLAQFIRRGSKLRSSMEPRTAGINYTWRWTGGTRNRAYAKSCRLLARQKGMEMEKQTIRQSAIVPRVIILTDFPPINVIPGSTFKEGEPREMYSDPDDVQSMIRLLLYTNDLEIEGLVASAGSLANVAEKRIFWTYWICMSRFSRT